MSRMMTKSAVRFARAALAVGARALPRYGYRSRKDYTQPQLFALLALRQYLGLDYRGLATLVAEWGELRRALGLAHAPHYSTLCYADGRLEKRGAPAGLWPPASPSRRSGRSWGAAPARSPSTARG
jgi:hypothetical protein